MSIKALDKIIKKYDYTSSLLGSASDLRVKNYNDIDIDIIIKRFDEDVKKFIKEIDDTENFILLDIKGWYKNKTKKYKKIDDINIKEIEKLKIDFAYVEDKDIIGVDLMIFDEKKEERVVFADLVYEKMKEGEYFKALKRYMSILRYSQPSSKLLKDIIEYVNSDIGSLSKEISKKELIELINDKYKNDKDYSEEIIGDILDNTNNKIKLLVDKYKKSLKSKIGLIPKNLVNNNAFKFIKSNKLF